MECRRRGRCCRWSFVAVGCRWMKQTGRIDGGGLERVFLRLGRAENVSCFTTRRGSFRGAALAASWLAAGTLNSDINTSHIDISHRHLTSTSHTSTLLTVSITQITSAPHTIHTLRYCIGDQIKQATKTRLRYESILQLSTPKLPYIELNVYQIPIPS